MLRQLIVGGVASLANIAIHALAMVAVAWLARVVATKFISYPFFQLITVMIAVVSLLMTVHVLEVIVWSLTYEMFSVAPKGTDSFDFAFVNYTTLGYGDVIPVQSWRLIGPMTAMNGMLLFGWSIAAIFEVMRRTEMFGRSPHGNHRDGH